MSYILPKEGSRMLTHQEFVREYLPELYNETDYEDNGSIKSGCIDEQCDVGRDEDMIVEVDDDESVTIKSVSVSTSASTHTCVFVYERLVEVITNIERICMARYNKTKLNEKFLKKVEPLCERVFDFEFMMTMPDDSDKIYVGKYPVPESSIPYYIVDV
jgi:hypothetical protein